MSIFDTVEQFWEVINVGRDAKKNGASGFGIFGSRKRGDHVLGKSDVDLMIERDGTSNYGRYGFRNNNVQVVTTPPEVSGEDPNSQALKGMKKETRWLWRKKTD